MRIGWCPGGRKVSEMLAFYAGTGAVRIFYGPGDGLPAADWADPRKDLAQVPAGCTVIVSHKDQYVDALAFVAAWQAARPDVDLWLIAHHEPEQQAGGDPTPAQFRASWTRQRQQVGDHPARAAGRLQLAVCWTLQWIRGGGKWRTWWPDHEADAVDLVLFDWYQYEPGAPNPFRPRTYEDPASAIKPMTSIATELGKDWGVAEVDHLRITQANGFAVDLDPTGELCADWYRQMVAAAHAAGSRVWCHFHRGHGDLTSRLPEQLALRDLIEKGAPVTRAPDNLLAVRRLLLDHLNVDEDTVRSDDLEPAEVGIVGDADHRGGYHCGSNRVLPNDYSVVESSRDRAGLTLDAAGLDVGLFEVTTPRGTYDLHHFSRWCVAQCEAGTPDSRDIREIIYSPDGKTVKRWDRLKRRTSGDDSHLWHTHFSFFRDSIKAGRDLTPLFRRYLTTIGLIREDDIMATLDEMKTAMRQVLDAQVSFRSAGIAKANLDRPRGVSDRALAEYAWHDGGKALAELAALRTAVRNLVEVIARESASPDEVRALLAEMPDQADADAIAARVLAGLGTRPTADVAAALVAAGQDPTALAAALTLLAGAGT